MGTLPQLLEQDVRLIDEVLADFLEHTEATTVLVIDKGGFLISSRGDTQNFDLTSIAALASGAFLANQTIATMVRETHFDSIYQQGQQFSMFIVSVDDSSLLVVIFKAGVSVGLVKYFSTATVQRIAHQLQVAYHRDPASGVDLSVLNMADTRTVFRRQH